MTRRYRRITLAIIAMILVSSLGYSSYTLYRSSEQQRAAYSYEPARFPHYVVEGVRGKKPKDYQPNCGNPQNNIDGDLCAQWAAVDQVMEANRLASVNVKLALFIALLTLIGTSFVGWTFLETRRVSRAELRAYLFSEAVGIADGTHHPDRPLPKGVLGSAIVIKNSGQTPAYSVTHWGNLVIERCDLENRLIPTKGFIAQYSSVVPPGGTITKVLNMGRQLTVAEVLALKQGTMAIYVYGRIDYRDAFQIDRWTNYRYAWSGEMPPPENVIMNFAESGNDAN